MPLEELPTPPANVEFPLLGVFASFRWLFLCGCVLWGLRCVQLGFFSRAFEFPLAVLASWICWGWGTFVRPNDLGFLRGVSQVQGYRVWGCDILPRTCVLWSTLSRKLRAIDWALEYHTLILFSSRNHYEIEVYTFFSLVT